MQEPNDSSHASPRDATVVKEKLKNGELKTKHQKQKTVHNPTQEKEKKAPAEPELKKTQKKQLEFPLARRINNYGWLGFSKPLLEELGWHKGMALEIDKNPDGSITVKKA